MEKRKNKGVEKKEWQKKEWKKRSGKKCEKRVRKKK